VAGSNFESSIKTLVLAGIPVHGGDMRRSSHYYHDGGLPYLYERSFAEIGWDFSSLRWHIIFQRALTAGDHESKSSFLFCSYTS